MKKLKKMVALSLAVAVTTLSYQAPISATTASAQMTVELPLATRTTSYVEVKGITLDKYTMALTAGGSTGNIKATVSPTKATNKNITWTSNNTAVATVSNGVVTPVSAGTAVITATSSDGLKKASCTVTVAPSLVASVTPITPVPDTQTIEPLPITLTPANPTVNGTSCTSLGMAKNNPAESVNNYIKLSKAILEGKKILVDGLYFITSTTSTKLTDKVLSITGTTADSELKIIGSSNFLFTIVNNTSIEINNLKITNSEDSFKNIFYFQGNALVPSLNVNSSEFHGNIRLVTFYGDKTINPNITNFGIKELNFTFNKVYNTRASFIIMNNVPTDKMVLNNNTISNFDYMFFCNSIDNDSPYNVEFSREINYLEVKNNYVICDDSWYGNTENGMYYCFVLFEGNVCVYDSNHVEGIKSKGSIALYDSYLSCQNLTYTNNVIKNNICFSPTKTNAVLLKSKEGGDNGYGKNIIRLYENNTYIIEKTYAEKLGQSIDTIWVDWLEFNRHSSSYIIRNNTFDVYDLRLMSASIDCDNIQIEANTFKAEKISGVFLCYRINMGTDYSKNVHSFKNNKVYANELGAKPMLYILNASDYSNGSNNISQVEVTDNYISSPLSGIGNNVVSNTLIYKDNTIYRKIIASTNLVLYYNGSNVKEVIQSNNNIYI